MPTALLQVADSSKEEADDDDSDSDEDDDDDAEECRCRTKCHDEGWGPWCYVQSLSCRVKSQCTAGGAARNMCVANDPAGPWTRCANLLSPALAEPQQPLVSASAVSQQPPFAAAASVVSALPAPVVSAAGMGRSSKQVEEALSNMMAQVDSIKQQDGQSMAQLKESYESEKARLRSQHDAILRRKQDLDDEIAKVTADDKASAAEVNRLEDVNNSLHGQLRQLEGFLTKESATLHSSVADQEKLEEGDEKKLRRPSTEALQVKTGKAHTQEESGEDDDSESDQDDQEDDDSQ
jgi:hypothetical protein